ncbi:MAG: PAS domain-containing sensor histidine kinase [Cycloclasticus sp.]|jgi:two-component system nitrogen regulation sensor histidine kinase GlnL|nr:MAG: PAS domain-containing sensor histidine kinase [Cycloclasticus sp. Phe_18]MBV1913104.1 PAS domain-containing sensor histidine kinase [Cycloclasticus sp.]MEE4291632.1 nitrogen regulation protein NR(II) [Cycloclasticus sp.]
MEKQTYMSNSVMEQLSIGILVLNKRNELIYINNAAEELLDISERKAIGIKIERLFELASFNIIGALKRCRREGAKITEHLVSINCPSGVKRNISLSMTLISTDHDNDDAMLIEMVDFNHYLQIDHEEKLLAQNELATDMLRGLAHEIKNPLGGIRGAAQLLSKELEGKFTDYIHVIIEEADRLRTLVDRMLGSSEVPNHQYINIHVILERVRQLVEAEVSDKIVIKTDYDPSIPDIKADKDQLIQALLNVVRNATQAVDNGGNIILRTRIHRNFTIGEEMRKLAVKIDIIDDGPGIEKEMQTKIFYPMVTGRTEGTGLGLSIAQTNVQRHNGIIEVTSEPGKTVFSTILPLEKKQG